MELYKPKLQEYNYYQELLKDKTTMSYNAGWEVNYDGYNYQTGTIDLPQSKWHEKYQRFNSKDNFFAYILVDEKFVGYCYYLTNNKDGECGIIIEAQHRHKGYSKPALKLLIQQAINDELEVLTNQFEKQREHTQIFFDLGFKEVNSFKSLRFNQSIEIVTIKKELDYDNQEN